MNRRGTMQVVAVVAALLLVAFVVGRPESDGPPLDPESVGEFGTLGLVEFLDRSGANVQRGVPSASDDVDLVLVLTDRLNGESREDLLRWIQAGGKAVITDTTSPLLATGLRGITSGEEQDRGTCEIEGLAGVEELSADSLALLLPVPNSQICFGTEQGAFVVQFLDGDGVVTGLGGAIPFTNARLDEGDNAVLAGRLLLTSESPTISVVYSSVSDGGGNQTVGDLIGPNVRWFGWHLVAVSFVGVLWAVRRFGRVVSEPVVVELPGSLAVRATAELHRRSATPERSEQSIRRALESRLRSEFGLPTEVDPVLAANVVAAQTGVSPADAALLTGASGSSETNALDRVKELDRIARLVFPDRVSNEIANASINLSLQETHQLEEPSNV